MKKQLPNILTLINLSLGIMSIIWASQNKEYLVLCSWLILIAMLLILWTEN